MNIHWKDWCWNLNTLATWCEELTHLERPRSSEWLKVGVEGDNRGCDGWMESWLDDHEFEQAPGLLMDREAWRAAVHRVVKSRTQLSNWTELNLLYKGLILELLTLYSLSFHIFFSLHHNFRSKSSFARTCEFLEAKAVFVLMLFLQVSILPSLCDH